MDSREAFESIAGASGFHDFEVSGNGCYSDDFLQHFYAGWSAATASCSEIPNSSDHIADAGEMVKGNAVAMGEIVDEHGAIYGRSMMIQFDDDDDIRAAIKSGQCRFTVFGGGV